MEAAVLTALVGVVSASIGGLAALLGVRANARAQERTAELRVQADLQLQADRLRDAVITSEITLCRAKLEELHAFLSEVRAQCSQTQAQLDYQMGRDLKAHTARWSAITARTHHAKATADLYFPGLSDGLRKVSGGIESFNWENREFLQTDRKANGEAGEAWMVRYKQIMKAEDEVGKAVFNLQKAIAEEAKRLSAERRR